MTFLPIVARELRVASRRRMTYLVRSGAALVVIIIGTFVFLVSLRETTPTVAKTLFGVLTGSAVLYALLSGVRDTADCLTSEKRDGTLGFLFLTDLKGYDVVFGKLAATSLNALYGVIAILPMLAIPLLMGGVTLGEFGRTSLVALNTLFFSLSLGIFMSSISGSGRRAAIGTFLILQLITSVMPGLGAWIAAIEQSSNIDRGFMYPSPGYNYWTAWDANYKKAPDDFWYSLLTIHGFGWVSLVLACLAVSRLWQDRPAGVRQLRWRDRWQLWSLGDLNQRSAFRKQLLDQNAFLWLSARARLKPAVVWGTLGFLGCAWLWGWVKWNRDFLNSAVYVFTAIILNMLLKFWAAAEAGRQLAEDRKIGALELLLSTPLTVRDILRGQFLALKRQFLGPLVLTLVIASIFLYACLQDPGLESERSQWRLFWIGGAVMLLADLTALYWVGMWLALAARNPNRAASASAARVLIIPPIFWALIMLGVALRSMNGGDDPSATFLMGLWLALSLITDILFSLLARHKLLTQFRLVAAQRYIPRAGFWRRLFTGSSEAPPPG